MKRARYEFFDEDAEKSASSHSLLRGSSQFVRDVGAQEKKGFPDWQKAWTNFLSLSSQHSSFHNNFVLKGHWAALEVVLEAFEKEAARVVKILVAELNVPDDEKTIKPVLGGVAGGVKFMHSNIFFKFAYDHVGIYNGDDQLAAKAASRELSALNHVAGLCIGRRSIVNGRIVCAPPLIKGLNVPLCITLNYLGFRISASTLLPIGIGTLMLGSEDGGKTVVNRDSMCEKLSQQVAKLLNLKIHDVGASSKSQKLWLAGDIEFHKGRDGKLSPDKQKKARKIRNNICLRYWIVDVARLMPPFPPTREAPHLILCNFLHPAVVKANHVPLSADAFSGFNKKSCKEDNAEVRACADAFFEHGIPRAAKFWDSNPQLSFDQIRSQHGVNARYLGVLFAHVQNEDVRAVILSEIVLRSCKAHARSIHSADELLALKCEELPLDELIKKKFGLEDTKVDWKTFLDHERFQKEMGIVEKTVEPVIERMRALAVLHPHDSDKMLLRGETLGKRSSSASTAEFTKGFCQVLEGTDFGEAKDQLQTHLRAHYLG